MVGTDADRIVEFGRKALDGRWKESGVPPLWDGRASRRIVETLKDVLEQAVREN